VNEVAEKYNGTAEMCKDLHEYNTTARSTRRLMPTASCSTLQQDLQPMMQPEMKQDLQPMMQPEMKQDDATGDGETSGADKVFYPSFDLQVSR